MIHNTTSKRIALLVLLLGAPLQTACDAAPPPELEALQATVNALSTQQADTVRAMVTQEAFVEYLATRPAPPAPPPGPDATRTPHRPILGGVSIEDGRCCVSAPAGDMLALTLTLTAESPLAPLTEMRVALGDRPLTETEMDTLAWEPFASKRPVTISVPRNWSSHIASAQFRDEQGNLSPVFHSEIAVEGR